MHQKVRVGHHGLVAVAPRDMIDDHGTVSIRPGWRRILTSKGLDISPPSQAFTRQLTRAAGSDKPFVAAGSRSGIVEEVRVYVGVR